MTRRTLFLGAQVALTGQGPVTQMQLCADDLTTHCCIVGMTGSGKTGLLMVMLEAALAAGVPVLALECKGDVPNAMLVPDFDPASIAPYLEASADSPAEAAEAAVRVAAQRKAGLESFGIGEEQLAAYRQSIHLRVLTPGLDAGERVNLFSSMAHPSDRWQTDPDGARSALSATISLILRVLGREADPARSREHVLIFVLAERRLLSGQGADIAELLPEILEPPIDTIGALEIDKFMSKKARGDLAAGLNTLLASPSFTNWRQGVPLDVASWMKPVDGKTPGIVLSVAHLDDDERALVLGLVLEEVLSWVRNLPGSQKLKALVMFDEVYGFLPPHPANPPTKRPLVALMKQARAFGVGVVIATQNPMDLDYRALSNAGIWCLGRLQTDADRERVLDGIANEAGQGESAEELDAILKALKPRWFVVRNAHADGSVLLNPRWAMSFLRGPMTRHEIRRARGVAPNRPVTSADEGEG